MNIKVRPSLAALFLAAGDAATTAFALQVVGPPERVRDALFDSRRALEDDPTLEYDPHTVLVRFGDATPEQLKVFARMFVGGTYIRSFDNVPGLEHLKVSMSVPGAVMALSMIPGVEFAEPDYVVRAAAIPNDAREFPVGDTNVVIADIGAGVDSNRTDLVALRWTNPGEVAGNAIDDDANGYVDDIYGYDFYNNDADPVDDTRQATHGPGALGARAGNGAAVTDSYVPSRIMALKFLNSAGNGQVSDAILCVNYAVTMGAQASHNSWDGGALSAALGAALDHARENNHRFLGRTGTFSSAHTPVFDASKGAARFNRDGVRAEREQPVSTARGRASNQQVGDNAARADTRGAHGHGNTNDGPENSLEGSWSVNTSAQDLDISLGMVAEPVERFIPTIATWRYIQASVNLSGEGRGIQVAGSGAGTDPLDGHVANGDNSVWFGVDFIADRADQQQFIGGEVTTTGGCLAYVDTSASSPGAADLCFAVIRGSSYSACRLPGVVRPGVRVSFQVCCRLHAGDWQLNPFHGPPGAGDPPRETVKSAVPIGSSLSAFPGSVITVMHHGGTLPGAMASTPDLLTNGAQASFVAHGSFTGKLFAFEYHPTTYSLTVADHPQPTRAKVSLTFRGLDQDPIITNRGTSTGSRETTLVGPVWNRFSTGVWLPPNRSALAGDLAAVGAWLRKLGEGERCVAIVLGDSNSAAAEGGVADALIQAVMTYYGGHGYDARPDVYWSATMSDSHPFRQFAGLGGRVSYGGDVSPAADDIRLVSGSGPSLTYPFPAPREPFTMHEWSAYAGSAMHVQKPGTTSAGLLSAFCTADASDSARWRLANIYGVQSTADGVMNDARSGHARLAGLRSGLLYGRSRMKAGDLVCLEAVLAHRTTNPGGSVQFALRAQDGADSPLPNGGRLVSAAGGISGGGWMTIDANADAVDAAREALAISYTKYPGQPMRPAQMNAWSTPTPPLSGIGTRAFTRVRSQPWIVGEFTVPESGIAISPTPVSYQPYVLLRRRTICSMFGVRIIGNFSPGQNHERLPWTVAMLGIGGSNATDQMSWLFSDPANRELREEYWEHVLACLKAGDANVLFVHVESQNSVQPTGVPEDALDDAATTWAAFTGAKLRALHTLAMRVGATSVCSIAINSPRLTSDNNLFRGNTLREMAPLLNRCAAIDLFEVIGQRETLDAMWPLYPYLAGGYDTAHPHYTVLGTVAIGSAFAAGLDADAAANGR